MPRPDPPVEEYWSWVAVALFLLLTVDLLTTFMAASVYGVGAESNPWMRLVLTESVVVVVAVHLAVAALCVGIFYGLMELMRDTEPPVRTVLRYSFEVWLALLVAGGLFVFANNVAAIVLGRSLVG